MDVKDMKQMEDMKEMKPNPNKKCRTMYLCDFIRSLNAPVIKYTLRGKGLDGAVILAVFAPNSMLPFSSFLNGVVDPFHGNWTWDGVGTADDLTGLPINTIVCDSDWDMWEKLAGRKWKDCEDEEKEEKMTDYNQGFRAARSHAVSLIQEVLTTHQNVPYEADEINSLLSGLLHKLPLEGLDEAIEVPNEINNRCEWCGAELDDGRQQCDVNGCTMWATFCECGHANNINYEGKMN